VTFEDFWRSLDGSGWFEAYATGTVQQFKETLAREFAAGPPRTAYVLGRPAWDSEWSESPEGFPIEFLQGYARASDGHFRPEEVEYRYVRTQSASGRPRVEALWVRFVMNGRPFEAEFPFLDEHLTSDFHDLCNQALTADGSRFRFFIVPPGDQYVWVALATPEAYAEVRRCGYLAMDDAMWGKDDAA